MEEHEILDHLRQSAWADVEYFSTANKEVRERWVVSQFLSTLGVAHQEQDLASLEQANKADVRFLGAYFQVKELPDPYLRRGKMYKDIYNSIKSAKTLEEVSLVGDARSIPPVASIYQLVLGMARELAEGAGYKPVKSELDLLIYVTRTRASLIQLSELNANEFEGLGWRSISCVNAKQAVVLFSSLAAPEFIREKSQILMSASG